jgi:hypothetical protein
LPLERRFFSLEAVGDASGMAAIRYLVERSLRANFAKLSPAIHNSLLDTRR